MVPKHNSENRWFVLDLSILSTFVQALPFRMLTVDLVWLHIIKDNWLVAIDLKEAY